MTPDPYAEARAALAEYDAELPSGDPEPNHARLAAAVRALLEHRSEPLAATAGDWEVTYFEDETGPWVCLYLHDPEPDKDDDDTVRASLLLTAFEAESLANRLINP